MSDQKQPISGDEAFNKAKDLARDNPDAARSAIDKVEDMLDQQTGGTFKDMIDKGGDFVEQQLGVTPEVPVPNPAPGTGDPQPQQDPSAPSTPSTIPGEGPQAPADPSFPPPDAEPQTSQTSARGGGQPNDGDSQTIDLGQDDVSGR